MSYVIAAPDLIAAAASDVAGIESSLKAAHSAAATPTTAVIAAAQDEVSAAVASLFSGHGQAFQAASAKAAEFHSQFADLLNGGAAAYVRTEAANASSVIAHAQSALSDKLSGLSNAAASGSATTGDAKLGPGEYGPGVYADGRVFVDPGCKIVISPNSYLSVAPGSEVWLFAEPKGSILNIARGSDVIVGPKSALILGGTVANVAGLNSEVSLGPYAILSMQNDSRADFGGGLILDHTDLNIRTRAEFQNASLTAPVIISNGALVGGSYRAWVPPETFLEKLFWGIYGYDAVAIRKFP